MYVCVCACMYACVHVFVCVCLSSLFPFLPWEIFFSFSLWAGGQDAWVSRLAHSTGLPCWPQRVSLSLPASYMERAFPWGWEMPDIPGGMGSRFCGLWHQEEGMPRTVDAQLGGHSLLLFPGFCGYPRSSVALLAMVS